MPTKVTIEVTIKNRLGLHARPAMAFVDVATASSADVRVKRADVEDAETVDGKSIMQVMMLAATQGARLEITCEGEDAQQAADSLRTLVDRGFDED